MGKLVNIFLERELCRMPALQASYFPNTKGEIVGSDADPEDDDGSVTPDIEVSPAGLDGRWSFNRYEGIREEKARGKEQKTWKFEGWDEDGLHMPRVSTSGKAQHRLKRLTTVSRLAIDQPEVRPHHERSALATYVHEHDK